MWTVSSRTQQCLFHNLHFRGKEGSLSPLWCMSCKYKSLNTWNASPSYGRRPTIKHTEEDQAALIEPTYPRARGSVLRGPWGGKRCHSLAAHNGIGSSRSITRRTCYKTPSLGHLPCTAQTRRWPCHSGHREYHQWPSQLAGRRSGSPLPGSSTHTSGCPLLPKKEAKKKSIFFFASGIPYWDKIHIT